MYGEWVLYIPAVVVLSRALCPTPRLLPLAVLPARPPMETTSTSTKVGQHSALMMKHLMEVLFPSSIASDGQHLYIHPVNARCLVKVHSMHAW